MLFYFWFFYTYWKRNKVSMVLWLNSKPVTFSVSNVDIYLAQKETYQSTWVSLRCAALGSNWTNPIRVKSGNPAIRGRFSLIGLCPSSVAMTAQLMHLRSLRQPGRITWVWRTISANQWDRVETMRIKSQIVSLLFCFAKKCFVCFISLCFFMQVSLYTLYMWYTQ